MQERIFEQFESVGHTVFLEISPLQILKKKRENC